MTPKARDADDADPAPPPRDRAEHEPEQPDHDQHADAQRDLVVRAELLDGEVLQPDGRVIDELGAHGVARRFRIAEQPGEQIADTERERGREQPGERRAQAGRPGSRRGLAGREGRCGHTGSTARSRATGCQRNLDTACVAARDQPDNGAITCRGRAASGGGIRRRFVGLRVRARRTRVRRRARCGVRALRTPPEHEADDRGKDDHGRDHADDQADVAAVVVALVRVRGDQGRLGRRSGRGCLRGVVVVTGGAAVVTGAGATPGPSAVTSSTGAG